MGFADRLAHAWNAFVGNDDSGAPKRYPDYGPIYATRPDRSFRRFSNERTILSSILTRMAIDVASVDIRHVKVNDEEQYVSTVKSELNRCLNVEANIDQTALQLKMDMALSLFDHGTMAVVPIETTLNPEVTGGYDVKDLRVGEIIAWYPQHVKLSVYNDNIGKGRREEIIVPKSIVAITENPLYSVMNEPNSTLQRLIRKLSILDTIDEAAGSGKLDVIIQLPYVVRNETKREQARERREALEDQLKNSTYGVGYIDSTEKITQLNRPAENNLLKQIEYLTNLLYDQLGITAEVVAGTANESTMINYYSRTVEPILTAITESLHRTFLTKTAQTQGHKITFFRDPLKLLPLSQLAELGDKLIRNQILTANEFRSLLGFRPSEEPQANQLMNPNLPAAASEDRLAIEGSKQNSEEISLMNS